MTGESKYKVVLSGAAGVANMVIEFSVFPGVGHFAQTQGADNLAMAEAGNRAVHYYPVFWRADVFDSQDDRYVGTLEVKPVAKCTKQIQNPKSI